MYDPVGNVTAVTDATVSRSWFRNQTTDGTRAFTYDALYHLISATGRENAGHNSQFNALPADNSQYESYIRCYSYDASGNQVTLAHKDTTETPDLM